jgi:hypothetical protein
MRVAGRGPRKVSIFRLGLGLHELEVLGSRLINTWVISSTYATGSTAVVEFRSNKERPLSFGVKLSRRIASSALFMMVSTITASWESNPTRCTTNIGKREIVISITVYVSITRPLYPRVVGFPSPILREILSVGLLWIPQEPVYCLEFLSLEQRRFFPRDEEIAKPTIGTLVLLLKADSATSTFKRVGLGLILLPSWFEDASYQEVRIT